MSHPHRLRVIELPLCRAGGNGALVVGPVFRRPVVLASCFCNALNALANRHLVARSGVGRPDAVFRWLQEYLRGLPRVTTSPELTAEWMARFPPARRAMIVASADSQNRRADRVTLTVKREIAAPGVKKARGIQAYTDLAVQYDTGPSIWALSRAIKARGPMKVGTSTFHYVPGYRGADIVDACLGAPVGSYYLECDGKNWDASVSCETRHAVISAIEPYLEASVVRALRDGVQAKGITRVGGGFARYSASGTVKSGHNDTTLGNTLLNLAVNGLAAENCVVLCAGDDSLVCGPWDSLVAIGESLPGSGVVPEGGIFRDIADVTFLGGRFYGPHFCPKIGSQLAKFYATATVVGKRERPGFADRMRASVPHFRNIPVLRALAFGPLGVPLPCRDDPRDGAPSVEEVCVTYGITARDVYRCEEYILGLGCKPTIVDPDDWPAAIAVMLEIDSQDPRDRVNCLLRVP